VPHPLRNEGSVTLSVFAAMRPFRGEMAVLQRSAIRSWLAVCPGCDVVLIDDEQGTTQAAVGDLHVTVVTDVRRAPSGVPLYDAFVEAGARHTSGDMLACTTADVLFPPNFMQVIEAVAHAMAGRPYLLVAARVDLPAGLRVDPSGPAWTAMANAACPDGPRPLSGIDLWVYPRSIPMQPPGFPIGRHGTDGWVVYEMKRRGIPVIDATPELRLLHQWHAKATSRDPVFHAEMLECVRLFEGMAEKALNLYDADWLWRGGRLCRPRGFRRIHAALSLFGPYRALVGWRRRRKLPHLYGPAITGSAPHA